MNPAALPPAIKVAVRDLVEFVLLSGDIQSSFVGAGRAVAGTRGHQKIQKSRPPGYTPEVSISHRYQTPIGALELSGRIDGIWILDDEVVLEEIKTTTRPLTDITLDNQPTHWGQAKVYAYLYALQNGLEVIGIQVTYLQLDSGEILEFRDRFSQSELESFVRRLVEEYLEWAATIRNWHAERDATIAELAFPFSTYRAGQRDFAVAVYRSIRERTHLFAQAPTGIGKTMATVFPALKALGEGLVAKAFYLTARTVGRGVAEDALAELARRGLRCKVLTLTAKEKICFLEKPDCRPEACEFALGHFDRAKTALKEAFQTDRLDRPAIETVSRSHRVCPFEFSLFLSLWADVIICDYNYAFDPRVHLRRFFEEPTEEYAFLVDEAHNMPDRAREMFSADLYKSEFAQVRGKLKTVSPALARAISGVTPLFKKSLEGTDDDPVEEIRDSLRPEGNSLSASQSKKLPEALIHALSTFVRRADAFLVGEKPGDLRETVLELYFRVTAFLRTAELFDEAYIRYTEFAAPPGSGGPFRSGTSDRRPGRGRLRDLRIRLFCLDPAPNLREALKRARSVIFFSATLQPMSYFFRLLGGGDKDRRLLLPSPFPPANLKLVVIPQIRTEFKVREHSYEAITSVIHTAISARKGNYLVYFPSFRYLNAVREIFTSRHPEIGIISQTPGMPEEERDTFLKRFDSDNPDTLVGFVVMGGIFGEGIDLRGERLIGSLIVGVGLPQICLERDLIKARFGDEGFDIAYRFPGMNRVMQAAGRVIRTETDRGIVFLIDERFTRPDYRRLFPREWSHAATVSGAGGNTLTTSLESLLKRFWTS